MTIRRPGFRLLLVVAVLLQAVLAVVLSHIVGRVPAEATWNWGAP